MQSSICVPKSDFAKKWDVQRFFRMADDPKDYFIIGWRWARLMVLKAMASGEFSVQLLPESLVLNEELSRNETLRK